ncbi:MAG: ATP-dependent Clp protease adapter protein ClpS [Alphaproteobacteria bacterium MarineAlpha6_Bin4]|nr:MAG: ATP-dependent Clp protease adapter protein ClpS [Alphaproteobacteria bacterium MarineAlpha6_Bin3]PPR37913.1 MAG: ATP-dependent Clp protease adapter protein ClpS [Alphaproteobacteria bacterium MarineAlpha6_Bin4]|tara:strand:- start:17765 stop:18094 length:330 start_codon:yes stop_codon:yes gene_type:complete
MAKNLIEDNQYNHEVLKETKPKKKIKKPALYKVVMLNDDFTPMDFVVYLLKVFFKKEHQEASKIMLEVHNKGAGICGIYAYEIAETKILKVINTARKNGFPLLCTLEKV